METTAGNAVGVENASTDTLVRLCLRELLFSCLLQGANEVYGPGEDSADS